MIGADWLQVAATSADSRRLWLRTPVGLEQLAAGELAKKLPLADQFCSHRNVFVRLQAGADGDISETTAAIRLADDVYDYWGYCRGLDRSKASVEAINAFLLPVLEYLKSSFDGLRYLRPTVSFVGKRNFNRFLVEEKIAECIRTVTSLHTLSNERKEAWMAGELRLRCHIEEDRAYFGLGFRDYPLHRRPWRNIRYDGQLHTPVAAAMAYLLAPPDQSLVVDPFCGSGTILIESGLQFPNSQLQGWDLNEAAIAIAGQSAAAAGISLELKEADSLSTVPPASDYYLISNPPWDEKHQIGAGRREKFISGLAAWLHGCTKAVLLLPEDWLSGLESISGLSLKRVAQTRIRGKLAWIIRLQP